MSRDCNRNSGDKKREAANPNRPGRFVPHGLPILFSAGEWARVGTLRRKCAKVSRCFTRCGSAFLQWAPALQILAPCRFGFSSRAAKHRTAILLGGKSLRGTGSGPTSIPRPPGAAAARGAIHRKCTARAAPLPLLLAVSLANQKERKFQCGDRGLLPASRGRSADPQARRSECIHIRSGRAASRPQRGQYNRAGCPPDAMSQKPRRVFRGWRGDWSERRKALRLNFLLKSTTSQLQQKLLLSFGERQHLSLLRRILHRRECQPCVAGHSPACPV